MKSAKGIYVTAMLIFGSIGLLVKGIHLPSGQIALVRGYIGCVFLLAACSVMKQKISWKAVKPNLLPLLVSGTAIGFNWILLFEAYKYTSIANATLSYYFAPVFVMFISPFLLKERLTIRKTICILSAVLGMYFVVGSGGETGRNNLVGIAFGLSAAVLYAGVVITNKFLKGLSGIETTLIQIGSASAVLLPYILLTQKVQIFQVDRQSAVLLLIVGIIHTGLAYLMYFTAIRKLSGQTIAVFSYIDPISAIIFSALILGEGLSFLQVAGGALILGAALISEVSDRRSIRIRQE